MRSHIQRIVQLKLSGKQTSLTLFIMSVRNSSFLLPVKTDDLSRVCSEVKNMEEGGPYTCLGCGHSCGRGISALYDLTKSHTRSQHKVHQIVKASVGKDGTFSHF